MDISTHDDRFGLPLSLVEALEADPSADATLLTAYLTGAANPEPPAVGAADRSVPLVSRTGDASDDMSSEVFNLDQLLTDPLIQMVMASDHIAEGDIRTVMHHAQPPRPSADRLTDRWAA